MDSRFKTETTITIDSGNFDDWVREQYPNAPHFTVVV